MYTKDTYMSINFYSSLSGPTNSIFKYINILFLLLIAVVTKQIGQEI